MEEGFLRRYNFQQNSFSMCGQGALKRYLKDKYLGENAWLLGAEVNHVISSIEMKKEERFYLLLQKGL